MRNTRALLAIAVVLLGTSAQANVEPTAAGPACPPLSAVGNAAAPEAALRLAWEDVSGEIGPETGEAARRELVSVLAAAGVNVAWRVVTPGEEGRNGEITIILLAKPPGRALPPRVMGAVNQGSSLRAAWVFVSGVERMLGLRNGARDALSPREREHLARALGRVAAHEVGHVLAPRLGHTPRGLMGAHWDRAIALAATMAVEGDAAVALRSGFAALTAQCGPASPLPGAGATLTGDNPAGVQLDRF